ncbi:MAG: AMP-binding protein [Acidimicrobiia bacterium]|nr:AMP-binding protein [Acidimicrobiia bacterium]
MTEVPTLAALLEARALDPGERPFLLFEDRVLTFAETNRLVNRAAHGLAGLGVGRGVGVAIMMPNVPEWLVAYFATQKLGAYAVPVNVALKGEGLRYVLDHCDASVLVTHPEHAEALTAVLDGAPGIREVVVDTTIAPDGWPVPAGWRTLATVMDAPDADPRVEIDPGAPNAIMYTSGTTGAPKGVVNRYGAFNAEGLLLLGGPIQDDDVLYTCLPLFHANALWLTTVRALAAGRPMALARRFSASRFWDDVRRYGVTTFTKMRL